jgi:outer membrane protein OmpA-like peptidoglycan-associated protein
VAFYHAADDCLYFSSDGHGGQGKADIFRTRLLPGGKWSEPENIEAVNTPNNDMYFSISAAGDLAYFSSDNSGTAGLEDIYTVPLSVILTPEQLAKVTKKIPQGTPVQKGPQAGHIETVYFDFDHAEIRSGETVKLDKVAQLMKDNPQIKIEIAGHACSVGKADYNLVLSKNRAESARRYLISKGISADRIIMNYYGEARPAEPNDPSKGNALNRRVEISIVQ